MNEITYDKIQTACLCYEPAFDNIKEPPEFQRIMKKIEIFKSRQSCGRGGASC